MMSGAAPLIRVRGVHKSFAHVHALRGIDLDLYPGEIIAIIGDNGAGKSTLASVIAGSLVPDSGTVQIAGRPMDRPTTRLVHDLGVETVYQSLALGPDLSIFANMFLGRETIGRGFFNRLLGVLDKKAMRAETEAALAAVSIKLPSVDVCSRELSGGQRQGIAVARAVRWAEGAILMDEPTAALAAGPTQSTIDVIRAAPQRGLGVIVITHDLPNMLTYAHRVVIMRHGKVVAERPADSTSVEELIALMVGVKDPVAS